VRLSIYNSPVYVDFQALSLLGYRYLYMNYYSYELRFMPKARRAKYKKRRTPMKKGSTKMCHSFNNLLILQTATLEMLSRLMSLTNATHWGRSRAWYPTPKPLLKCNFVYPETRQETVYSANYRIHIAIFGGY
jgi:hypothetical protein